MNYYEYTSIINKKKMRNIIVLKICIGTWENASRDIRELSVCRELGMYTIVMAKGIEKDKPKKEYFRGFEIRRISTRPFGGNTPNVINRLFSLFSWAYYIKQIRPDIISGHDLAGLTIGWIYLVLFSKHHKPKLVYDSHEFELGRVENRGKLALLIIKYLERILIKRCDFSIMVNQSIADKVQSIHKLKQHPLVVRNIPTKWLLNNDEIKNTRDKLCKMLGVHNDVFMMMYHGGIIKNRGIEKIIEVLGRAEGTVAVILGNGENEYIDSLEKIAIKLNVFHRMLFLPAVSIEELYKYVGSADVGMIIHPLAGRANHQYMLPNKLFENIQALTPVVCSNFIEISSLVKKYKIGLTVDSEDLEAIVDAVMKIKSSAALKKFYKNNLKTAKEELCWENEKKVLKDRYKILLMGICNDEN